MRRRTGLTALFWRYLLVTGGAVVLLAVLWWGGLSALLRSGFVLPAGTAAGQADGLVRALEAGELTPAELPHYYRWATFDGSAQVVGQRGMDGRRLGYARAALEGDRTLHGFPYQQYHRSAQLPDGTVCLLQFDYSMPYGSPALQESLPEFQTCATAVLLAAWLAAGALSTRHFAGRLRRDAALLTAATGAIAARRLDVPLDGGARVRELGESLAAMERAARPAHFFARETRPLGALLGDRLTLSPTRVEQYYRCRFSYFLQYVLRIRPRRRAELSPLESGSLVHYILEHVMRRAGAEFPRLAPEELARLAGEVADQYVAENMPAAGRRFAYLVERLKRGVTRLLAYLQAEQAQSLFHPAAFEQEIGTGEGAVPPLTLRTPDGRTVQVQGKIDRVDVMEREGRTYLRVVDYKTGNKAFNLDEVYCGLNTQMLLYLFTLRSNAAQVYKNPVAAGVLYLAGDPVLKTGSRAEAAAAPVYKVDGLVLNDELVVRGMDRDATGMFVPFAFGKDGAPRASAKLASLEKLGNIEKHLDALVVEMARGLYAGEIDAVPLRTAAHCPCDVCDYRPVCLHEDGRGETSVQAPKDVFETRADACKAQGEGNI